MAFNSAVFFFVLLRAGTQEGSRILACTAAGFDPGQSFAAGILSRIRELFWALLGLAFFYRHRP